MKKMNALNTNSYLTAICLVADFHIQSRIYIFNHQIGGFYCELFKIHGGFRINTHHPLKYEGMMHMNNILKSVTL